AEIIRIDRPGGYPSPDPTLDFEALGKFAFYNRNRRTVRINLKAGQGRATALRLIANADALIEGFRPGVMEKLGLGPAPCLVANQRLVYARLTGWGQTGPLAPTAGHDLNYIALSGALGLFNPDPATHGAIPPLVGDMGGGGLYMAFGLLAGIIAARSSGRGSVIDAAIVDGSAGLYATIKSLHKAGAWPHPAGANIIDGGRYFYRVYSCADGQLVAVGAIEPAFRKVLLTILGLIDDPEFAADDPAREDARRQKVATIFSTNPRDEWAAIFAATDGCVTPVLSMEEAEAHPHATARGAFTAVDGVVQPAPGPRFGDVSADIRITPQMASRSDPQALAAWGFPGDEIAALQAADIVS
ncbi:MAG: CaiB/BaiF CoA-transferase family protein, partial [Pseudolabrys sp.]|nr:CaiB/BaiF CoA-transferase family protein [Pseudolabrys sp.]